VQGAEVTAIGVIDAVGEKGKQGKRRLLAIITDGSGGYITGVWFNQYRFVKDKLLPGRRVAFSGKIDQYDGPQMVHP
jgi:RecG-like helicase